MATDQHLQIIENTFGYTFADPKLLKQSVTAAGAEEDNHEGNRQLAQIGDSVISLAIAVGGFEKAAAPSKVNEMKAFLNDKAYRAKVAEHLNLASCIKLCPRSRGKASTAVLNLALCAIVGAAYTDSGDLHVVARIIKRLNLLCNNNSVINPLLLQESRAVPCDSSSACKELIEDEWSRPPPIPKGKDKQGKEMTMFSDVEMTGTEQPAILPVTRFDDHLFDVNLVLPPFHVDETNTFTNGDAMEGGFESFRGSDERTNTSFALDGDPLSMQSIPDADEINSLLLSSEEAQSHQVMTEEQQGEEPQSTAAAHQREATIAKTTQDSKNRGLGEIFNNLDSYLVMETQRCHAHGHGDPRKTFFTPEIISRLRGFSTSGVRTLVRLYVALCSPEAVATLRESVVALRSGQIEQIPSPMRAMTVKERFAIIEDIGRRKAYFTLTERLHILRLYEDHCATAGQQDTWTVVRGPQQPSRNNAGNPRNFAKAAATKVLLAEVYPDLREDAHDYDPKYAKIKRVRRLGARLHLLKSYFGEGVIGLIQCNDFAVTKGLVMSICNRMLLGPTEEDFNKFVILLDRSQGQSIRKWSRAVAPLIDSISTGDLRHVAKFPLEDVEEHSILQLPKFSELLLALICPQQIGID